MNQRTANKRSQAGVGLIEVLVAVLVLAIGLLGIALVQTRSLALNNGSMTRAQAVVASYTILDAMRTDRVRALAGDYNGTVDASGCPITAGTLAETALQDWCASLRNFGAAAVAPTGRVQAVVGSPETFEVTITFDSSRDGDGSASGTVVTRARL